MPSNKGVTSLKRRRRPGGGMREFDRLPADLRIWLTSAVLPWGPRSVHRTYTKALARTESAEHALQELDRIQSRLIARYARKIWGADHPDAMADSTP